jgi:guanylate kinase
MNDGVDENGPPRRGLLVVLSGPSGVGKTTIVRGVQQNLGGVFSVSATTRPRSDQERHGVDYLFVDEAAFQSMIAGDELLEYAQVFGRHYYGTPRAPVEQSLAEGAIVFLDIDVQGALQVHRRMPGAFMIFILPPSDEVLLDRLRGRGRDEEEAIRRRFDEAKKEIAVARASSVYDAFVVNDDLAHAREETTSLIRRRLARAESND